MDSLSHSFILHINFVMAREMKNLKFVAKKLIIIQNVAKEFAGRDTKKLSIRCQNQKYLRCYHNKKLQTFMSLHKIEILRKENLPQTSWMHLNNMNGAKEILRLTFIVSEKHCFSENIVTNFVNCDKFCEKMSAKFYHKSVSI